MRTSRPWNRIIAACAGLSCFLAIPSARADTIVHIPASQDVTLFGGSDATTNNTSSGPGMFVGSDALNHQRGIVEFNIASFVPAGATITGATLTMTLGMVAGTGGANGVLDSTPRTIRLFDVTTAWNPSTNGATGRPGPGFGGTGHGFAPHTGDATWNYAVYNTVPWTNAGGDFSATESAHTLVSQTLNSSYSWSSSQMSLDVQGWLNGTFANDGWLLKNDSELSPQTARAFYTREGASEQSVPTFAPDLTVSFVVPEPASAVMMVGGVFGLLCRRSRSAV